MHRSLTPIVFIFLVLLFSACNTLVNVKTVDIEIAVPAKVKMPEGYRAAAIRYNNCNVAPNPVFSYYLKDNKSFAETNNLDSIASKIYFQSFNETLEQQFFFDSISEIQSFDYSEFNILNTFDLSGVLEGDSLTLAKMPTSKLAIPALAMTIGSFQYPDSTSKKVKILDPEFGLYSYKELSEIADSTGANLLFSLDYFAAIDGIITEYQYQYQYLEVVYILSFWNIYDLRKKELLFFYDKIDTISWEANKYADDLFGRVLPNREEAVLNAAGIAGSGFAEFLIPHWELVQRMYYKSGNVELSKTEEMIEKGNWLEAAEIWKKNVVNKNKRIAAKSMFNLALANEINGNIDAAIDWTVKSFHVFNQKNEIHYWNCMNYIKILGQRKLDIKQIKAQLNVEIPGFPENKNE